MLRAFRDVLGLPCWGVKRGWGSFLTLDFGEPRLVIREPIHSTSESLKVRRSLSRRHVYVSGAWHFWIYDCNWVVRTGTRIVGDSSTRRRVDRGARELDGQQQLVGVLLAKRGARTRFIFDLGSVLETRPYSRKGEQWMLFMPGRRILTFRADRRYTLGRSDRVNSRASWKAV